MCRSAAASTPTVTLICHEAAGPFMNLGAQRDHVGRAWGGLPQNADERRAIAAAGPLPLSSVFISAGSSTGAGGDDNLALGGEPGKLALGVALVPLCACFALTSLALLLQCHLLLAVLASTNTTASVRRPLILCLPLRACASTSGFCPHMISYTITSITTSNTHP